MEIDKNNLEHIFREKECADFKWIDPSNIVTAQWVRMKCSFGCEDYGKRASCPPHVPSVSDCERFFSEYSTAVLFHFKKSVPDREERHGWLKSLNNALLEVERGVFLEGFEKAFLLFAGVCYLCAECADSPEKCNHRSRTRPTMEGMAVDVFSTAQSSGYDIEVKTGYDQQMDRFGLLMIN